MNLISRAKSETPIFIFTFNFNFILFLGCLFFSIPGRSATQHSLTITVHSYEEPVEITEISAQEKTRSVSPNHKIWNLKPARFAQLIKEFISLPGSVDTIKTCPREYIKFEYRSANATRIELTCNEDDTSTRRKYVAFAKQII